MLSRTRSDRSLRSSEGGRTPRAVTPTSSRSSFVWEEENRGTDFQFSDDDAVDKPLLPLALPEGWHDEGGVVVHKGPLSFVEANWFKILIGAVIFLNSLWLLAQAALPWLRPWSFWMDIAFLAIYVVETIFRIGHWGLQFFSHPEEAGWNWFDLSIVLSGVLEEMDTIEHAEKGHAGKELMALRVFKPLRLLARLARFMRVIRLCRVLVTADFSWVESPTFQSTVGVVIILNAVIMGLETDSESAFFEWTEQFILAFFVLEAVLRIRHRGWDFFTSPEDRGWNIVDFTIVASGVVDDWILKAWSFITQQQQQGGNLSKLMTLARLLRLMRILRLVRVVRAIRPLYMLAIGVVRAMQSMFWVLVLTFVALYAIAILTTRAIGRGELLSIDADIPEETRLMFNTIADSMFALFAFMNSQQWHKVAPLLNLMPWTKLLFVVFTIYSSWALLSVMTGVVSDHIQYVREVQEQEDKAAQHVRQNNLVRTLSQIFAAADPDGSGKLRRSVYLEILNSPFQVRRLQQTVKLHLEDIRTIFDLLDLDGAGTVDFEEFCESLDWISKPVTGRRLLKVDLGVKLVSSKVQQGVVDAKKDFQSFCRRFDRQQKVLMARFDEYQSFDLGGPSLGYRARFRSNRSLSNISRASSTWSSESSTALGRPAGRGRRDRSMDCSERSMDSLGLLSRNTSEESFPLRKEVEVEEEAKEKEVLKTPSISKKRSFTFVDEGAEGSQGKSDPKVVAGLFAGTITTAKLKDSEGDSSVPRLPKSLSWGSTEEVNW